MKYQVSLLIRVCAGRRSPCGERGLKFLLLRRVTLAALRRSPCGERGLKCVPARYATAIVWSLPVRGAWVEIYALYASLT